MINSVGGDGLKKNFRPHVAWYRTVSRISLQYHYSMVTLLRYLAHYPKAYWTDGP